MCNLGNRPTKRRDVMNKEIEEMMLTVPQKIVAYDGNPAGQHLYGEQRQEIAEALYNAGYRKVWSDAKGNLLKIQNLCIEFDEMGYEPTTLCENPEQTAKKWKSDLMYEIGLFLDEAMGIKARYNKLKAENERWKAEQREKAKAEKGWQNYTDTWKEVETMCKDCPAWSGTDCTRNPFTEGCLKDKGGKDK